MSNVGEDGILLVVCRAFGLDFSFVPGATPKKPFSGLTAHSLPSWTDSEPCDIVADVPCLVALLAVDFRRNEHCEVGLAASGRECSCNILDLALRIFDAEDKHMLSHPAFFSAEVGSDTESEALLAEKNVSAVTGVDGPDGVVLREVADIAVFFVEVSLCSADP